MRFCVKNGLPYLIHNGNLIPVDIEGNKVTCYPSMSSKTTEIGRYTLIEITAKLGKNVSSASSKARTKKKNEAEEGDL